MDAYLFFLCTIPGTCFFMYADVQIRRIVVLTSDVKLKRADMRARNKLWNVTETLYA
eukprot:jgi/Antlo1/2531/1042